MIFGVRPAVTGPKGVGMVQKGIKRNLFQRIFGIPATGLIEDSAGWSFSNNTIVIDLDRVPALKKPGGGVRLEDGALPDRILVIHGNDGFFHAYRNRCGHGGRRMDPVPGENTIQCCSVGKTTCDYMGKVLSGSAKKPTQPYRVEAHADKLTIYLE